jgi:hypothetical protein
VVRGSRLSCGAGRDVLDPLDTRSQRVPAGCEGVGLAGLVDIDAGPLRGGAGRVRVHLHRVAPITLEPTVIVRALHGGALLARGHARLAPGHPRTRVAKLRLTAAGAAARDVPVVVTLELAGGGDIRVRFRSTLRFAG